MYYQFNNFTGRLIGSHGTQQPYFPIRAAPLSTNDPPKIVFGTPYVKPTFDPAPPRNMSTRTIPGTNVKYGEVPASLKAKMEKFQIESPLPVHLRGGPMDRVLFGVTGMLCFVGLGMAFYTIYELSYPKKA